MPTSSATFGERFAFGRWWQSLVQFDEADAEFGRAVARSSTQIGEYRKAEHTPNSRIWPDAAERMGVDGDWLTGRKEAPPDGWADRELFLDLFRRWLETARRQRARETAAAQPEKARVGRGVITGGRGAKKPTAPGRRHGGGAA